MCSSAADDNLTPVAAPIGLPITATVALSPAAARARLWAALAGTEENPWRLERPALGAQFKEFFLSGNEEDQKSVDAEFQPLLKGGGNDYTAPLTLSVLPPNTADAGLAAYIGLPVAARAQDLLISHSRRGWHDYWHVVEYQQAGTPQQYSVDYIVHLAPVGSDSTKLHLFGVKATVLDGKEWRILAGQDGLGLPWPRHVDKRRDVLPSPTDKRAVLATLVKLLN